MKMANSCQKNELIFITK